MKNVFPEYADRSKLDYDQIWKDALFIFDTNVLLNLYRYQASTRDELLEVIQKLAGRIWIPHHVGLEFQRNRLKVITEQNKRFVDVRKTIEKARSSLFDDINKLQLQTRHSLIDPHPLTSGFEELVNNFLSKLEELYAAQQKPTEFDELKEKIETIFENRIGAAPQTQEEIDRLYKQAEERFKQQIPPGYKDEEKGEAAASGFMHGGIIYKRKYGDYLIWHQMLIRAKETQVTSLIFITDDGKEDWWEKLDFNGTKTIGPRPELIDEVHRLASVKHFLMYNPEGFLKYSKEYLQAQVSDQTLEDVRKVANEREKAGNPAVSIDQETDENSSLEYNSGIIKIKVLRDTQIATGTGKLSPAMSQPPFVQATLLKMPNDLASDMIRFKAATGTVFDFNINIVSATQQYPLPQGEYVFSYTAEIPDRILDRILQR